MRGIQNYDDTILTGKENIFKSVILSDPCFVALLDGQKVAEKQRFSTKQGFETPTWSSTVELYIFIKSCLVSSQPSLTKYKK